MNDGAIIDIEFVERKSGSKVTQIRLDKNRIRVKLVVDELAGHLRLTYPPGIRSHGCSGNYDYDTDQDQTIVKLSDIRR